MKVFETKIFGYSNLCVEVMIKTGDSVSSPFHCHPELEVVYIVKGSGRAVIGNNVTSFQEGDMAVIGPNLPHVWTADPVRPGEEEPCSIVIYFNKEFFGSDFYKMKDMKRMVDFLQGAQRGIWITGKTRELLHKKMERLAHKKGFKKLIGLMEILHIISISPENQYLNAENVQSVNTLPENDRLKKVIQYICEHFRRDISLEEIASIAHLSPPSFCRLFKSKTNKPFVEYVNELRISYACKLLNETDQTIYSVGAESGFNTLSNFNKQFKAVMRVSPKQYRNGINAIVRPLKPIGLSQVISNIS